MEAAAGLNWLILCSCAVGLLVFGHCSLPSLQGTENLGKEIHIFWERIFIGEGKNGRQVGSCFETSPRQKSLCICLRGFLQKQGLEIWQSTEGCQAAVLCPLENSPPEGEEKKSPPEA